MVKTLVQRQQDEIEALRRKVAELQSLLTYAAGGSQNSVSENVQLRLENDKLRKQIAFFWSVVPTEILQEHPKLLSPQSGERTAEHTDWQKALAVGCTIVIRHGQEDVTSLVIDGCLYPGDMNQFIEVVPRQIMTLLNGIPMPADLQGTPPPSIDAETLGYILRSLSYARSQSEQRYKERRKQLFDQFWPEINSAYDQGEAKKVKDKEGTRRDFYQFCDRTMEHQDKLFAKNVGDYRRWEKGNGPLKK